MNGQCVFVAYDVTDQALERRVVKLLKRCGVRYEYSVFVCSLSQPDLIKMANALRELHREFMRLKKAGVFRVALIPVCMACTSGRVEIGDDFSWIQGDVVM